ncbi:MAG TPA: hypothetical protein IAD46_03255 [Candidatus Pelethenecus faecipullorum]|uniref:Uncharacterized protein n=1 Tax=Candidatus Pelethenecus faecipullorum TaxID=2840900 RepID=A0A9D1GRS0_9MOLU|nr:hypothetical protein [Candidatus Pelethenecus faecipullorum]
MSELEEGLSLADLFRILWKNKIKIALVFGLVSVTTLCFLLFFFIPSKRQYTATFRYEWLGLEEETLHFMERFDMMDLVSYDNLKSLQQEEGFEKIDVDQMIEQNAIELNVKENDFYELKIEGRYFDSPTLGKKFIERLIFSFYQKAVNLTDEISYQANLNAYNDTYKVGSKINFLENQLNLLDAGYENLIEQYHFVLNGSTLEDRLMQLRVFESNYPIFELRYLTFQNAYMTKEEYQNAKQEQSALKTELRLLQSKKTMLLSSLEEIYASSNNSAYIDTALTNYLNTLHEVDLRITTVEQTLSYLQTALDGTYSEEQSTVFLSRLDQYKEKLAQMTEIYEDAVRQIFTQNTKIHYESSRRVDIKDPIGIFPAVLISLFIGGSFGAVFGFSYDVWKNKKQALK